MHGNETLSTKIPPSHRNTTNRANQKNSTRPDHHLQTKKNPQKKKNTIDSAFRRRRWTAAAIPRSRKNRPLVYGRPPNAAARHAYTSQFEQARVSRDRIRTEGRGAATPKSEKSPPSPNPTKKKEPERGAERSGREICGGGNLQSLHGHRGRCC